jgi:hypothetical protein
MFSGGKSIRKVNTNTLPELLGLLPRESSVVPEKRSLKHWDVIRVRPI